MHLVRKFSDTLLLLDIEIALVDAICDDILAKLTARQMMQHETLLTRIDDSAIIKLFELLCELRLLCKISELPKNIIIHSLCCIIIIQALSHRHMVLLHALRTAVPGHHSLHIHTLRILKCLIRRKFIEILPIQHTVPSPIFV